MLCCEYLYCWLADGNNLVPKDCFISVADAAETPAISNAAPKTIEICLLMIIISMFGAFGAY